MKLTKTLSLYFSKKFFISLAVSLAIEYKNSLIDLYYILVMTPATVTKDRFIFDGEAPFGVAVNQVPSMGDPTHFQHSVSANLAHLRHGNEYDFAYTLKENITDSITTLVMVHDMQTNIVFLSVSPIQDSLSQSYQPEAFDPKLFEFPDYFFEGFPISLGMDFTDKLINFKEYKPQKILRSSYDGFHNSLCKKIVSDLIKKSISFY